MNDSDETQDFELLGLDTLPDGWKYMPLGELVDSKRGISYGIVQPGEHVDNGVPIVRVNNLQSGRIESNDIMKVSYEIEKKYQRTRLKGGEVLLSLVGSLGQTAVVSKDILDWNVARAIAVIPVNPEIEPEWVNFALRSPLLQHYIRVWATTTVQATLNLGDVVRLPIPIPPEKERKAIVDILGSLDAKIELNRRMNGTLESMARAVFHHWFMESEEVVSWETAVLNDLAESILGGDWGKDTNEDRDLLPAYCIRGADIPDLQSGGMGKMPLRYLKPSSLEKRKLQDGDIVVEISGGSPTQSTGRPVFISSTLLSRLEHPLVASNFCRVFRPKDTITSNFVYFWLRYLYARDEFFQFENGTTGIKNFAFTIFCEQYNLNLPPKGLLENFYQFSTTILEAMQSNAKESRTLVSLRDSLLPKLMKGEVKVKE